MGADVDSLRGLLATRAAARWAVLGLALWLPQAWAAPFSGVLFADVPALDAETLLPAYRRMLGQPVTDALSRSVSFELAEIYRRRGYLPPAPRLVEVHHEAGVLIMEMREPHVARVQLDGREHADLPEFRALLQELENLRPLRRDAFDQWLKRANGLGFNVHGSLLRVATDSSEYLAHLEVTNRRWQALMHVDNRGPEALGHEIGQLTFVYRAPREAVGELRIDAAAALETERLRYAAISGGHRVRERGDRVQWRYARSESTLPIPGTDRWVDYERERAEVALRVPLVHRSRQRSHLILALHSYDLDQFLDDGRRLRRDRIRAAELGYTFRSAGDGSVRHTLEVALARGFEGLGASLSPAQAKPDFTVLTARHRYSRNLGTDWRLLGDMQVQVTGDRLPASERFSIGGSTLGGAFDPASLSGDEGFGARLGVERPLHVASKPMIAFVYYDHAYVWSRTDGAPAADAGSAGAGLRGSYRKLSWSAELGIPVRTPPMPSLLEDDVRVFFSLTQRF